MPPSPHRSPANPHRPGILGTFEYMDDALRAMDLLGSRSDAAGHELYSPTSYHELMDLAERRFGSSQVKWFTLTGALTGVATGFGLPLYCDWDWPIVVGGKTAGIPSLPAYVVFGFELMVLFGAVATIAGMLIMGRLPNIKNRVFDVRTTDDRFAIFIPGVVTSSEPVRVLRECGAEDVVTCG